MVFCQSCVIVPGRRLREMVAYEKWSLWKIWLYNKCVHHFYHWNNHRLSFLLGTSQRIRFFSLKNIQHSVTGKLDFLLFFLNSVLSWYFFQIRRVNSKAILNRFPMPCPQVSGYFWKQRLRPRVIGVFRHQKRRFSKTVPIVEFLKTPVYPFRLEGQKRRFSNTMISFIIQHMACKECHLFPLF